MEGERGIDDNIMGDNKLALDKALATLSLGTCPAEEVCAACNALRKFGTDIVIHRDLLLPAPSLLRNILRAYVKSSAVQKCAAMALASLGEKRAMSSEIAQTGCLAEMLSGWREHSKDESLVKDMLVSFRTMTTLEECRALTCELDGIHSAVSAMRNFSENESIQNQAISLLVNLVYGSSLSKSQICTAGGVNATLQAMRSFNSLRNSKLQAKGCTLLRNIAADSTQASDIIVSEGGVTVLAFVAETYRSDTNVLEQCVAALVNIAHSSISHFRDATVRDELIQLLSKLICRTLSRPNPYGRFHDLALKFIGIICTDDGPTQLAVGETTVLSSIFDIARVHIANTDMNRHKLTRPDVTSPVQGFSSHNVVRRAAGILRYLAFQSENRRAYENIENSGAVLVKAVEVLRVEPMAVEQALLALGNMVFDSGKLKAQLATCNCATTILSIMSDFQHASNVQEACCLALRALCEGSAENSEEALKFDGVRATARVVQGFPDNSVVMEHALAFGIVLLQNCQNIPEREKGILKEEAASAAKRYPFSVALRAQNDLLCDLIYGKGSRSRKKVYTRTSVGQLISKLNSSKSSPSDAA